MGIPDKRRMPFTIVDDCIIDDTDLDAYEKCTYLVLCRFSDNKTGQSYPSRKTIAKMVGCSDRKIDKCLKTLTSKGYIKKTERQGKAGSWDTNLYTILGVANHVRQGSEPRSPGVANHVRQGSEPRSHELDLINYTQLNYKRDDNVTDLKKVPYQEVVEAYHQICTSLPRVRKLTAQRRKHLNARWKELGSLDEFKEVFSRAQASSFLTGNNDRGWNADFDWLINESNMTKVIEGKYDDKAPTREAKSSFIPRVMG